MLCACSLSGMIFMIDQAHLPLPECGDTCRAAGPSSQQVSSSMGMYGCGSPQAVCPQHRDMLQPNQQGILLTLQSFSVLWTGHICLCWLPSCTHFANPLGKIPNNSYGLAGEMVFFGYNVDKAPFVHYGVADTGGKVIRNFPIHKITSPTMMHDFAVTEHYTIFYENSLVFDGAVSPSHKYFLR